jgi:hypothetical protein
MALILDSLYDALKAAGAPEEQARAAARDVADYDNRLHRIERDMSILKWMVGVVIAVQLGTFWMQWQVVGQLASIDARLTAVEARLTAVEARLPDSDRRSQSLEQSTDKPFILARPQQ